MEKWEYCVKTSCCEKDLNELGAEGWELVAVTPYSDEEYRTFYFKRKVEVSR